MEERLKEMRKLIVHETNIHGSGYVIRFLTNQQGQILLIVQYVMQG